MRVIVEDMNAVELLVASEVVDKEDAQPRIIQDCRRGRRNLTKHIQFQPFDRDSHVLTISLLPFRIACSLSFLSSVSLEPGSQELTRIDGGLSLSVRDRRIVNS